MFLFNVNMHWRNGVFIMFCTSKLSLKPLKKKKIRPKELSEAHTEEAKERAEA